MQLLTHGSRTENDLMNIAMLANWSQSLDANAGYDECLCRDIKISIGRAIQGHTQAYL